MLRAKRTQDSSWGSPSWPPGPDHTIPRLELCAAVLAVQMYELIRDEMDIHVDAVSFYTDSRIVLGYIHNSSKRFYVYVSNRVTRIRRSTHPDQWSYVPTDQNPADHATRYLPAAQLDSKAAGTPVPVSLTHNHTEETGSPTFSPLWSPTQTLRSDLRSPLWPPGPRTLGWAHSGSKDSQAGETSATLQPDSSMLLHLSREIQPAQKAKAGAASKTRSPQVNCPTGELCDLPQAARGGCRTRRWQTCLPTDSHPEPPFTNVGLDVFGPWAIMTRRTRGGSADTRLLRSDRGTNFVGACKELGINTEDSTITAYLRSKGCSWVFNPPHASHMGGAWERLIGVARRILDAMLLQTGHTRLTHEVLSTLMAEVMAIINARPLVPGPQTPTRRQSSRQRCCSPRRWTSSQPRLETLRWRICTGSSGNMSSALQTPFGRDGEGITCLRCRGRRKWTEERPNVKAGDVVLLKDSQAHRNEWPVGVVVNALPSRDKRIRKVEIKVVKEGTPKVFFEAHL
ncbi:hypothetical protein SKAU_G00387500 [Synaphobranchus kaupii]|uniref:DUF5641 domain-containing protein n=1 Tax=Synaphobranchus kaupii TaxID=118154 RepID=A0A9Q1EAS3_SYNKA|nr:hypothetical protein SKAU_G00387500 [Synaphobranchus kaupii]